MPNDDINVPKSAVEAAREIAKRITAAMGQMVEAARLYAQALDQFGSDEVTGALYEIAPDVPSMFWVRLELIGREQLDHRLLFGGQRVDGKLRKLPLSQQRAALDTGIAVLVDEGDHLLVQPSDLTPVQIQQVFAGDHIRSLSEQRAWVEIHRPREAAPEPYQEPYVVRGGKVEIRRPVTLTRKEIARLLEQMA